MPWVFSLWLLVLSTNLGQGHRGGGWHGCLGNLKIQNPSRRWEPTASFPYTPLVHGHPELEGRTDLTVDSRRSNAGSSRAGVAALITSVLQAPIRSQKGSRDTAFNNYH